MMNKIIKLGNYLDENGLTLEADYLDRLMSIYKLAEESDDEPDDESEPSELQQEVLEGRIDGIFLGSDEEEAAGESEGEVETTFQERIRRRVRRNISSDKLMENPELDPRRIGSWSSWSPGYTFHPRGHITYFYWPSEPNKRFARLWCDTYSELSQYSRYPETYDFYNSDRRRRETKPHPFAGEQVPNNAAAGGPEYGKGIMFVYSDGSWKKLTNFFGEYTRNSIPADGEQFQMGEATWGAQNDQEGHSEHIALMSSGRSTQRPATFHWGGAFKDRVAYDPQAEGIPALEVGCSWASSASEGAIVGEELVQQTVEAPAEVREEPEQVEQPEEVAQEPQEQTIEQPEEVQIGDDWTPYISQTAARWYGDNEEPETVPRQVAVTWAEVAEAWGKSPSYSDWREWYAEQHSRSDQEPGKYWRHGKSLSEIASNRNLRFMRPEQAITEMRSTP